MLHDLVIPIISLIGGLVGALIGGLASPYLTYRLNDKTRRLELYKLVYPQTFAAASKLLDDADKLGRTFGLYERRANETRSQGGNPVVDAENEHQAAEDQRAQFAGTVLSVSWLLGSEVLHQCRAYSEASDAWWNELSGPDAAAFQLRSISAQKQLQEAVKSRLDLHVLDELFDKQQDKPKRAIVQGR